MRGGYSLSTGISFPRHTHSQSPRSIKRARPRTKRRFLIPTPWKFVTRNLGGATKALAQTPESAAGVRASGASPVAQGSRWSGASATPDGESARESVAHVRPFTFLRCATARGPDNGPTRFRKPRRRPGRVLPIPRQIGRLLPASRGMPRRPRAAYQLCKLH